MHVLRQRWSGGGCLVVTPSNPSRLRFCTTSCAMPLQADRQRGTCRATKYNSELVSSVSPLRAVFSAPVHTRTALHHVTLLCAVFAPIGPECRFHLHFIRHALKGTVRGRAYSFAIWPTGQTLAPPLPLLQVHLHSAPIAHPSPRPHQISYRSNEFHHELLIMSI